VDALFRGATHKRRPTQIVEAQFALPHLIAVALVHGHVGIMEVTDIRTVRVLEIAARMSRGNGLSAKQLTVKFTDWARNAVDRYAVQVAIHVIRFLKYRVSASYCATSFEGTKR
jgi:hypothetical protein